MSALTATIPASGPPPEVWQDAKQNSPGLYRTLLGLVESRDHRIPAQHAQPCTTCRRPAVTRVPELAQAWLCDWCLARVLAHAKNRSA